MVPRLRGVCLRPLDFVQEALQAMLVVSRLHHLWLWVQWGGLQQSSVRLPVLYVRSFGRLQAARISEVALEHLLLT